MKNKIIISGLLLLGFISPDVGADGGGGTPLMVNPSVAQRPGAPATGGVTRNGGNEVNVRLINSCFGTNLRGVTNPLAPNSIIHAHIILGVQKNPNDAPEKIDLKFTYPAAIVTEAGIVRSAEDAKKENIAASTYKLPDGAAIGIYGNTVDIRIPNEVVGTVNNFGDFSLNLPTLSLQSYAFQQEVTQCGGSEVFGPWGMSEWSPTYNCGEYMGQNGELSVALGNISKAANQSVIEINAAFPGQTGFCGGYYSPLMLFFDQARPAFSGQSEFRLSLAKKTYWVEPNAPGAFLALDANLNGKIDGKEELFGDQEAGTSGFELLAKLDSNKNKLIDAKDKRFQDLLLWFDKNGDGISQAEELVKLAERVQQISLQYKKGVIRPMGPHAEARERATFRFKGKNGKIKTGEIIDIWFGAVD